VALRAYGRWVIAVAVALGLAGVVGPPAHGAPEWQGDATGGCGASPPSAPQPAGTGAGDTPQTVEARVGQPFSVTLPSNPTTGYSWALAQPLDDAILQLVQNSYQRAGPAMPGAGGTEVWTFEPLCAGYTTIALKYRRPWEPDDPSARLATFYVQIS